MLFNSIHFLVFFAFVYACYVNLGHRWQNWLLLGASNFFYGFWAYKAHLGATPLALLWTSILVDYNVAIGISRTDDLTRRKLLLACSITAQLGLLSLFKYYNFFVDTISSVAHAYLGLDVSFLHLGIILPIGISFYTFHTMSYVIDVYHRKLPACRSLVDFALFVSFFPQLVAGPIARGRQLLPQMESPRTIEPRPFVDGLFLFCWGMYKKVVVADRIAHVVNLVFSSDSSFPGLDKLLAVYGFAFQIYCDFSGYSDMARGLAKLMGFDLMLNFNLPYFATNPSDFWRRWHISLSTWLRDYLYLPLGGSRGSVGTTYLNLFLTMLIGGIWHGASWMMVLWGLYQGACLIVHRLLTGDHRRGRERETSSWLRALQIVLMFQVTCVGWLIFRADSIAQIVRFLVGFATDLHASAHTLGYAGLMLSLLWPLALYEALQYRAGTLDLFLDWSVARRAMFATAVGGAVVWLLVFHRSLVQGNVPFIYFQF
jgi:alginate O-acetyltransferase complex protein AlgI